MASRILVINDDQSLLDLYKDVLEGDGYEVLLSLIAYQEVSTIEQMHLDLIILDAKLGHDFEGLLLLQKLKMYPPTQAIPVLLCSAWIDMIRQQEANLRDKGIPILYKPFHIEELLQNVRHLLTREGTAALKS
jgi:DNA-binding response OmpR family regulator